MTLKLGIKHIQRFMATEYSDENILFWKEARWYAAKQQPHEEQRQHLADINHRYIVAGAELQVNLPDQARERVQALLDAGSSDHASLVKCAEEVFAMVERDTFPQFLKSENFQRLLMELRATKNYGRFEPVDPNLDTKCYHSSCQHTCQHACEAAGHAEDWEYACAVSGMTAAERALPNLVLALTGSDAERQASAAGLLAAVAIDQRTRSAIGSAGGIAGLVRVTQNGSAVARCHAAEALTRLAMDGDCRLVIRREGGIDVLAQLLWRHRPEDQARAAAALANLAIDAANAEFILGWRRGGLGRGDVVKRLANLAAHGDDNLSAVAGGVLKRLAAANARHAAVVEAALEQAAHSWWGNAMGVWEQWWQRLSDQLAYQGTAGTRHRI